MLERIGAKAMSACMLLVLVFVLAYVAGAPAPTADQHMKFRAAQTQLAVIEHQINIYAQDMGGFPDSLDDLLYKPQDDDGSWQGPYMKDMAADPWGAPFRYLIPGELNADSYDLWSGGPDGESGTADDIGNWTAPAE